MAAPEIETAFYVRLDIQYFGIPSAEIADVVDALDASGPMLRVSAHRVPQPPAASPPFTEFSVILLALSISAHGFLKELGKDLYHQFRAALVKAIKEARGPKEARGGWVFGVRVNRDDSYVTLHFREPPTEVELAVAFTMIPDAVAEIPPGEFGDFEFDPETGKWQGPRLADDLEREVLRRLYRSPSTDRPQASAGGPA